MSKIDFIIVGLPRSRTAWIANYLTYDNMVCIHEATRNGIEGLAQYEGLDEKVGIADTGAVLIQDALIAKYPHAQWIIIDREPSDITRSGVAMGWKPDNSLHELFVKLNELRSKAEPLVVKFDDLDNAVSQIANLVNPDWSNPRFRHDMLVQMNVQVQRDKLIPSNGKLHQEKEPPTLSPSNRLYQELIWEMCSPNKLAYNFIIQTIETALTWDHIIDGDAIDLAMTDRVFKNLLVHWPINPFIVDNAKSLLPVLSSSISDWQYSYMDGASKDCAYSIYADVPAAVAYILGGQERVDQFMPRIRKLVATLRQEDDKRDGNRK